METTQIRFEIPEKLLHTLNVSQAEFTAQTRLWTAIQLFRTAKLTLMQAAELANLERGQFLDALDSQNIPVIDYPASDLTVEMQRFEQ